MEVATIPPPRNARSEALKQVLMIYLAAAFGALCLGLGDLLTNGNAAAVLKLAEVIRQILWPGLEAAALVALVLLVLLGGGVCWIHQPDNRIDAFARGFSVFALLAVATPYQIPSQGLADPVPVEADNPVSAPSASWENPQPKTASEKAYGPLDDFRGRRRFSSPS